MNVVSQNIWLCWPFLWYCEMIQFLHGQVRWSGWRRHCDVVLGCCQPEDAWEGESSALGDPGSSSHDDVDGWMSGADDVNGWGNLVFFNCGWPQVPESMESETTNEGATVQNLGSIYVTAQIWGLKITQEIVSGSIMRVDRIKMTASRGGPGYFCVSSLHMSDIQSFTLMCSRIGCSL